VYLNSLPGLYAMLSQEKKHGLELNVRGWLLSGFQSDLDQKVARVFDIKDFGPLPLMQDFVKFVPQLFQLYTYGMYYSAIGMAGVTAERLCYDLLNMTDFKINGKLLSIEEKAALREMRFSDLIDLLSQWGLIQESTKTKLHDIRRTRNRYVHPTVPPFDAAGHDAKRLIELVCEVARIEFGPNGTGRYVIQDGALTLRPRQTSSV
jgi:hypothetical protein